MINIIDYGMGNLRSVVKAVEKYTDDVKVSRNPEDISDATGIIMPGDGAFAMAMENLKKEGWVEPLKDYINKGGLFMGICLGYQLLFTSSEEFGYSEGLDIIPGKVVKFKSSELKVPHMGWNTIDFVKESKFLNNIENNSHFYFIHTYYPVVEDKSWIIGEAEYGEKFTCIVGKENVFATQFHPEKSHNCGLKIIENFVSNAGKNA